MLTQFITQTKRSWTAALLALLALLLVSSGASANDAKAAASAAAPAPVAAGGRPARCGGAERRIGHIYDGYSARRCAERPIWRAAVVRIGGRFHSVPGPVCR